MFIQNGITTWDELVEKGLANESRTPTRGQGKFRVAFLALDSADSAPQSLDDSIGNEELLRGFPPEVQAKFAEPAGSLPPWRNPEKHGVV
jgi:hypothetical protein